jgi:RNase P/RNase MRP subunit p29
MSEQELKDEFSSFLGNIVGIATEKHDLPLYGRVTAISKDFLTIEKRDGRIVVLKKKTVLEISETKNQSSAEVS